jgi:hypothetical protein
MTTEAEVYRRLGLRDAREFRAERIVANLGDPKILIGPGATLLADRGSGKTTRMLVARFCIMLDDPTSTMHVVPSNAHANVTLRMAHDMAFKLGISRERILARGPISSDVRPLPTLP